MILQNFDMLSVALAGAGLLIIGWLVWATISFLSGLRRK